ncbi:hypothetical protein LMH73_015370, partial [Vibrio splendidus]
MNTVRKLNPNVTPINSPELTKLQAKLNVLDWWQMGEEVSRFCSLPESELMNKEALIPQSSQAGRMNHATVEDLITKTSSAMGLAMDWNDWQETIHACILKKRYAIHLTNKTQIVHQFNDITAFIGREPFSNEEYHVERDNLFSHLKDEMSASHRAATIKLNNELTSLELEKSRVQKKVDESAILLTATKVEYEDKMKGLQLLHDSQVEAKSQESLAILETEKRNLTSEYNQKIEQITGKHLIEKSEKESQIGQLNAEISNLKALHEAEVNEMLTKYIHMSEYRQVELSLAKERDNNRIKNDQMALLTDESSRLQISNDTLSDSLAQYETEVKSFQSELMTLQHKIVSGEITVNDIDAARVQEIEARNASLESMHQSYEAKVAQLEGINEHKTIII